MRSIKIGLLSVAIVLFMISSVGAQEVRPDDRYRGYYPTVLVRWPTALPDLAKCMDFEYYEPDDLHLVKYASLVKIAGERTQESAECVWMLTRNDWRWVLRPAGTKVAVDDRGRDLFDFGSPNGKVCANPRSVGIPIPNSPGANLSAPPLPASIPPSNEQKQEQAVGRTNVDVTIPEAPPPPSTTTTQTQTVGDKTVTVTVPPPPVPVPTTTTQTQKIGDTTVSVTTPPQAPPPPPPNVTQTQSVGDTNITITIGKKKGKAQEKRSDQPRPSSHLFSPASPLPSKTQIQQVGSRTIEVDIEEPESRWGFTFGGTLGRFDSDSIRGIVEKMTNRNVCDVSGWYADLGASYGRPRASFWRFVLTAKVVDEWSNSRYFCSKCGTEISIITRDMKVWGFGIERVQLFGPEEWSIRPTVTGRLGVGIVTGQAEKFLWSEVAQLTTFERVGAKELFGSRYLLDVGLSPVAMTVPFGKHALVVEGPGITWPGLHYAKASLTLRP